MTDPDEHAADLRLALCRAVQSEFRERTGLNPPDVLVKGDERRGYTVTVQTHVHARDLSPDAVSNVVSEALLAFEGHSASRDAKVKAAKGDE